MNKCPRNRRLDRCQYRSVLTMWFGARASASSKCQNGVSKTAASRSLKSAPYDRKCVASCPTRSEQADRQLSTPRPPKADQQQSPSGRHSALRIECKMGGGFRDWLKTPSMAKIEAVAVGPLCKERVRSRQSAFRLPMLNICPRTPFPQLQLSCSGGMNTS